MKIGILISLLMLVGLCHAQTISSLTLSPTSVYGDLTGTGKVTLSKKAGASGLTVALSSSSASAVVAGSVTVPTGATSATFTIQTSAVSETTVARIKGTTGSKSAGANLTILAPKLDSITFSQTAVFAGESFTGMVTIIGQAPSAGLTINLSCKQKGVMAPASLIIPAQGQQATFTITTQPITVPKTVTVTAKLGSASISAEFTLLPIGMTFAIGPDPVVGGTTVQGTVTLTNPAPQGGFTILLSSNKYSVTVPTGYTVQQGRNSITFDITTMPVRDDTDAVITAKLGTLSTTAPLMVLAPDILNLTLVPAIVDGGGSSIGTVTLSGEAPTFGLEILLSSNQASAVVPYSIYVPAGSMSATFPIKTNAVSYSTTATITAVDPSNALGTAALTITPPATLAASGWARFRGNIANTGLGSGTGADGAAIWVKQTLNQSSWSSPAIGPDGTIFVGSDDGNLYALYEDTVKWKYQTGARVMGSPAVDSNGVVYVGSDDFNFYAINPGGTLKWKFQGGQTFQSSPTVGPDGTIYCGCFDNNLYAFNPNGSVKWTLNTGGGVFGSPAIGADGTIYLGVLNAGLLAIYPSGAQKWDFGGDGGFFETPCIGSDGTIYVTSGGGHLYAVNPNGSEKWVSSAISGTGELQVSSPGIGPDGTIYVGSFDGNVYAINPDGSTKWSYLTGGYVQSSPAIGPDGVVYISSNDGNIYAFNSNGAVKWTAPYGGLSMSPALAPNGNLYVSTPGIGLVAIGVAPGATVYPHKR